jgi:hypothetical protein
VWTYASLSSLAKQRGSTPIEERRALAGLVREVFGNPFRLLAPRAFPPEVVGLAEACYLAFPGVSDQLAILADALEELGEVLADHCRQPLHVKGCHVVDWVLGRG